MQSPEVKELIREYADQLDEQTDPVFFEELTRPQELAAVTAPRGQQWLVAVAAAAVVLILVGGAALLFTGTDHVDPADTPFQPSAAPFDLETDSLCDWFTAQDMNRLVAEAQKQAGSTFEFVPFEDVVSAPSGRDGCWSYPADGFSAWGSAGWQANPAADGSMLVGINRPYSDAVVKPDLGRLTSHEMLDEAATYHLIRYHVAYDAGLRIYLQVEGHEEEILDFAFGVGGPGGGTPKYEDLGLAVANELLQGMNWIRPDAEGGAG